jgi:hypothetical protein
MSGTVSGAGVVAAAGGEPESCPFATVGPGGRSRWVHAWQ